MYAVSTLFAQYLIAKDRQFEAKVIINAVTYLNDSVIDFDIGDSIVPSDDFTLGSVISSSLSLSLCTSDIIPNNAKLTPYVRLNGTSGYTEWLPLGDYYIDERKLQNNVWKFSCFDALIMSDIEYGSSLAYPAKMSDVMGEICLQLGVTLDPSTVINPAYTIDILPVGYTLRAMLSFISAAHGANVILGKDGKLKFVKIDIHATKTYLTPSDYVKAEQTNPLKLYTRVLGVFDKDGNGLTAGDVYADADHTLSFYCPFVTQDMIAAIWLQVKDFTYMPFTLDWRGNPQMEVGDLYSITQVDGTIFTSMVLTNKMSFKGGLKTSTITPSLATNKSEFAFKGSMKQYAQEVADEAAQSMIYYTSLADIIVGTTPIKPAYLTVSATKNTNLKLFISLSGVATINNTLTMQIQIDGKNIPFVPKQILEIGDNIVSLTLAITQITNGVHYVGVFFTVDSGTFTIPINNLQVVIEGGSLQGGLSAEPPHAEVVQLIKNTLLPSTKISGAAIVIVYTRIDIATGLIYAEPVITYNAPLTANVIVQNEITQPEGESLVMSNIGAIVISQGATVTVK